MPGQTVNEINALYLDYHCWSSLHIVHHATTHALLRLPMYREHLLLLTYYASYPNKYSVLSQSTADIYMYSPLIILSLILGGTGGRSWSVEVVKLVGIVFIIED